MSGLITVRLAFAGDGEVADARVLSNTLVSTAGDVSAPAEAVQRIIDVLRGLRLPGAGEGSWAIVPARLV